MERLTIEDEVVRLREENTALKVKNGELEEMLFWLKAVIVALFSGCLVLLAALFVVPGIRDRRKSKKGTRKGSLLPLFTLLKDIMTVQEVTLVLNLYLGPDGTEVLHNLSASTSTNEFFHNVLAALQRRNLLGSDFFTALILFIPSQREYILKVQAEFLASGKDDKSPGP